METKPRITLEEYFERFDKDHPAELVDGQMVPLEPGMSRRGAFTAGKIVTFLSLHVDEHGGGFVLVGEHFVLELAQDRERIRIPDVAFVRADRVEFDGKPTRGAPDLAIEVISPSDKIGELTKKTRDYFAAGARLVWVIVPEARTAMVHRPDGTGTILSETDVLEGEDVLPGLAIRIRELFPPE
jgi:Uma2 family endonuclease